MNIKWHRKITEKTYNKSYNEYNELVIYNYIVYMSHIILKLI